MKYDLRLEGQISSRLEIAADKFGVFVSHMISNYYYDEIFSSSWCNYTNNNQ